MPFRRDRPARRARCRGRRGACDARQGRRTASPYRQLMDAPPVDALVIGAGPAGLTAALYLTRFKRRVRVVHDGTARALWVPRTRNVPGVPDGIVGKELIERQTDHARRYGAEIASVRVAPLERARDHFRATLEDGDIIAARGVILATATGRRHV